MMLNYLPIGYNADLAYKIICDSCGNTSLVEKSHGQYCPFCGDKTISNIKIIPPSKLKNMQAKEVRELLVKMRNAAEQIGKLIGLNYNLDGYCCDNLVEVDCDDDVLRAIDYVIQDIGNYLGK